jgi:hypothetical protein
MDRWYPRLEGRHNVLDWRPPDEEARRVRACDDAHDEPAATNIPHEILRLPSSSRTEQLAGEALGAADADATAREAGLRRCVRPAATNTMFRRTRR